MSRPTILYVGGTLYWTMRLYNSSGALVDADSTPTVAVRKNGASTGDSVTVSKRAATTGIYDCSYNPASEAEGDQYTIEESATIDSTAYQSSWEVTAVAVVQGNGGANTVTITVKDDSDNLVANSVVQLLNGAALIDKKPTNASGVALLAADNGTYTRIVTVPGGGYSSDTDEAFEVDGATTGTVVLTAHTTASTVPNTVTGQYTVIQNGVAASGLSVQCKAWARPNSSSDDNYAGLITIYDVTNQTNGSGVVQFTNLPTGYKYQLIYGTADPVITEIPNGSTGTVNLNSMAVPGRG